MKKSFGRVVLMLVSAVLVSDFLAGCPIPSTTGSDSKGSLAISLTKSLTKAAKTLSPSVDLNIATYDVSGTGPSLSSFSATSVTSSTYTASDLAAGSWAVTATGKNAAGASIVQASATVTVVAGQTASVSLNCIPIDGTGTLSLSLSWPAGAITSPSVLGSLTPIGESSAQSLSFTTGATSASWSSSSISDGYYTLVVQLVETSGTTTTLWGKAETVLVLSGEITTGSWVLSSSDLASVTGGITVAISSSTNPPITISLSGNESSLMLNSTMTVSASASVTPATWQWYLNGSPLAGETSASITIGTGLSRGPYWLDVVAFQGGTAGSAGCQFRVASFVVDHTNYDPSSLSDTLVAKAATLKVYFEHASVGRNICDGLDTLASVSGRYSSGRMSWSSSSDPSWYDANNGLGENDRGNPGAAGKISNFSSSLTASSGSLASKIDVAMFKFCYIDTPSSGTELFNSVRTAIETLQGLYPGVVFVWWTMPIETSSALERQAYNDCVRQYCVANGQWLLDLADLESHDDSGTAIVDGNGRELLYSGYTTDGGHLPKDPYSDPVKNSPGSLKAAKAYWKLLAEIARGH